MSILLELLTILLGIAIVGLWTYAWLLWCFKASVRHWLLMLMPTSWKEGRTNASLYSLSSSAFTTYMLVDFKGPAWLAYLLTCRYCLSAHIALAGVLLLAFYLSPIAAIFAWAGGAGIANLFYKD